jgi:hypothetical protein
MGLEIELIRRKIKGLEDKTESNFLNELTKGNFSENGNLLDQIEY